MIQGLDTEYLVDTGPGCNNHYQVLTYYVFTININKNQATDSFSSHWSCEIITRFNIYNTNQYAHQCAQTSPGQFMTCFAEQILAIGIYRLVVPPRCQIPGWKESFSCRLPKHKYNVWQTQASDGRGRPSWRRYLEPVKVVNSISGTSKRF